MTRDDLIGAIELAWSYPGLSGWDYEVLRYRIIKAAPHVNIGDMVFVDAQGRSPEQIADEALGLESERSHLPVRPWATHEELTSDIALLQYEAKFLGSRCPEVLVPLTFEFPNAGIADMVWETHIDVPAEEVVAEIYRREEAAKARTGEPPIPTHSPGGG